MVNGWKVTAIIFIILFVLSVSSTIALIKIGLNQMEKEEQCSDTCYSLEENSSYYFDIDTCYCLQGKDIIYQEEI